MKEPHNCKIRSIYLTYFIYVSERHFYFFLFKLQNKNTTLNNTRLENLTPATHYKVQVKSIPIFAGSSCPRGTSLSCHEARGFWSEVKERILITKEDGKHTLFMCGTFSENKSSLWQFSNY